MKKGSTWFLRAVLVLMGIIALAVGIFALPSIYSGGSEEFPSTITFLRLFMAGLYLS